VCGESSGRVTHLATLKEAGLVNGRREGRCAYYRVEPRGMKPLIDWIAHYRAFWTHHVDLPGELPLAHGCLAGGPGGRGAPAGVQRQPRRQSLPGSAPQPEPAAAQFLVNDVQAEHDRLAARGVKFTVPVTSTTGSIIAVLDDTRGNLIQLTQLTRGQEV
jgi:hypothetical protein